MDNNDKHLQPDFLNDTVQSVFIPTITSTGIKDRKSKKLCEKVNFEDSISFTLNQESKQLPSLLTNYKDKTYFGIEPIYLQRTKPPEILMEGSFHPGNFINENNGVSFVLPREKSKQKVDSNSEWLANTLDEDYFRQHTKPSSKLSLIIPATSDNSVNLEQNKENNQFCRNENTISDIDSTINYNAIAGGALDNTSLDLTYIDGLLDGNNQSKLCNVTQLAYELENLGKKKKETKNLVALFSPTTDAEVNKTIQLLADKNCLLWIGVPVQNNDIKSFKLNLHADQPLVAKLTINQSCNTFHFTNQFGNDYQQSREITLEPLQDKKLYIVFHPTTSAYHSGMVIVNLGTKKFKVRLFGYAESAKVELVNFNLSSEALEHGQKLLQKQFSRIDKNNVKIQLFNSGARTAYVAFFSHEPSVRFQPRSFLLIPKTTKEIKVSSGSSAEKITFFFIHVDEELRRACRISCTEYGSKNPKHKYNHFNVLQIFAFLPEENVIQQYSLPNYDWRPSLIRQINTSICYGRIDIVADSNSANRPSPSEVTIPTLTDASVRTIDQRTAQSSVTGNSTLSNIENLNSKTLYMNSAASFVNGLNATLNGVIVQKDVNKFPDTPLNRASYLGILIRNNNYFPVHWLISDLLLTSSGNSNSPETSSSRYSLSSWPKNFSATSMSLGITKGVLKAFDAVVVPVKFQPASPGLTECKCNVRVFTTTDESFVEKELDFSGEGVRQDNSSLDSSKFIPEFSVTPQSIHFCNNQPGKLVEKKLQLHNSSNHVKEIFLSQPAEPFNTRAARVCIEKGKSLISIYFNSKKKGVYENVLILSDDEGHSTFVLLKGELK